MTMEAAPQSSSELYQHSSIHQQGAGRLVPISSGQWVRGGNPGQRQILRTSSHGFHALQLSFGPPPPHLLHLPHLLRPSLHHQYRIPRGEDSSNSKPKTFIQAHVFLQGPSAKDINFYQ
ncbi:hypothetical protein CHARACLAT_029477 [Characodon lateralis]|uniref:Uncharacterized protein n=1 Tax=Characodon lateralis TaxID=208331 RepID=A0ABU7F7H4_9TELE|nr:hypothetical protein [Characodon lateralis]